MHFAEWVDAIGEAIGKNIKDNQFCGEWVDDNMPATQKFIPNAVISNTLLLRSAANTYEEFYGYSILDVIITMSNNNCSFEEAADILSKKNTFH